MSVPDGDFELDDGSWSLRTPAEIQSVTVYEGENALRIRSTSDFDGSNNLNGEAIATLTSTAGVPFTLMFWVNGDESWKDAQGQIFLQYSVALDGVPGNYPGGVYNVLVGDLHDGWNSFTGVTFTPTSNAPLLRIRAVLSGVLSGGVNASWYVDLVSDQNVVIKLSERAIDAVVATLVANLATELTAIDTERGDGLTIKAPASGDYYKYPRSVIGGSRAQVEVFEDGSLDFTNAYTDHQNNRAVYTAPLMVRLTWFNSTGETVDVMYKRMRRYGSAIVIALVKNPTLEDNDDAIQVARIGRFIPHHVVDGEDSEKAAKCVLELPIEVDCEEIA